VALIMGYSDWASFEQELADHRARVNGHFADIIASDEEEEASDSAADSWHDVWIGTLTGMLPVTGSPAMAMKSPRGQWSCWRNCVRVER